MIRFKNILLLIFFISVGDSVRGQSGGQSGATQLLINPWAKSAGVGGANVSFGKGIETERQKGSHTDTKIELWARRDLIFVLGKFI